MTFEPAPPERRVFANRTLNLRALVAVGYDMDYTLVHYRIAEWEQAAYDHLQRGLAAAGLPVDGLSFDPAFATRGLFVDTERGNLVKANRFGFVKRALHGRAEIPWERLKVDYARVVVDPAERRWELLSTFFSISEACMYAQLVERLDAGALGPGIGYGDLYRLVRRTLDRAHMEGELKRQVMADPARYVESDPLVATALFDQRAAGKRLLLVTNSEWTFTDAMMRFSLEPHLPKGGSWRSLFDVVVVGARKPDFFRSSAPLYEVLPGARVEPEPEGGPPSEVLRPAPKGLAAGRVFAGGSAQAVEEFLGVGGDAILYVGDHLQSDVDASKSLLRWRTALVVRELEADIRASLDARSDERALAELMVAKEALEHEQCRLRLELLRRKEGYGERLEGDPHARLGEIREELSGLDARIAPLAKKGSEQSHPVWGLVMRTGNDKSWFAREIERTADVYTSRVSNFALETPFAFLRSRRLTLPHDGADVAPHASEAPRGEGPR